MLNTPLSASEQIRTRRAQHDENRSRHARAWGMKKTLGYGEYRHPEQIDFQLAFIGMPAINYGYTLDGVDLVPTRFPRAWGFVHQWRQDARGHYVGCWVSTIVETVGVGLVVSASEPNYPLIHSFQFNGLAYKSLPSRVGSDLAG